MHRRVSRRPLSLSFALVACLCAGMLTGCNAPPALTKAELDAGKLPNHHPKLTAKQKASCRTCHHEQPAIKK
jgi:hypothetical protein